MLFVGEQELADGLYSLKDVTTEQEQKLTVEAIAERISQRYI
jgi:histidyl-tRNA synthetase